jgi:hypothetical protein
VVTVSSANKTSGGEWLSASSGGGSKVILNLNAGATGVDVAGSPYTGTVEVVADGGITDNMYVTLRVLGECNATSASVTPTSLTFQAYVGGQNPSAQTIRVKDNCGHAVSATVSSKPDWLTLSNTGTGEFSVSCVDSYLEDEDSYAGTITLNIDQYSERSVSVTLKVTDTPPPPQDDSVTTVPSGHIEYYNIGAGQTRYFKFIGSVSDCSYPIQVGNTPAPPYTVHMLLKRDSPPAKEDFGLTWPMPPSQYNCRLEEWAPEKTGAEDLYWNYNTGSQAEFVQIGEPMQPHTFYIMLYNNGTQTISTRLSVRSYD